VRWLAVLLAVVVAGTGAPALGEESGRVAYVPPVDAPVVDGFRPPPGPYGAGNRGIDYATAPGTPVRAAADGEVVFAGQVGGDLHVVVLHADGIRTSYSFLRTIAAHRGDRVRQGQAVGTAGDALHFGARAGDTYIDPRLLFGAVPTVHLVPDDDRRPAPEYEERSRLERMLRALRPENLVNTIGDQLAWAREQAGRAARWGARTVSRFVANKLYVARVLLHYLHERRILVHAWRVAATVPAWLRQRLRCTPESEQPPPLPERRVAVLVGGLASSSEEAAIDRLDTAALGYAPGDVVRFSYLGGSTTDTPYEATDTTVDLRRSARRLRQLLEQVHAQHPGVPVDLIAHSQGGLVARQALAFEFDPDDHRLPRVANLVTLATPHQGADLATALAMLGHTWSGKALQAAWQQAFPDEVDPRGMSLRQMAEKSEFLDRLNARPLPPGVRATSIGARGDLLVPSARSHLPGGNNVVVSVPGILDDHRAIAGSSAARREVALAVSGMAPTCQSLPDMLADTAVSAALGWTQDSLGRTTWLAATIIDHLAKKKIPRPWRRKRR
jgi:hypothetical protein